MIINYYYYILGILCLSYLFWLQSWAITFNILFGICSSFSDCVLILPWLYIDV